MRQLILVLCLISAANAADFSTAKLVELARTDHAALPAAITSTFSDKDLTEGHAVSYRGTQFFFAIRSAAEPTLIIDEQPRPMKKAADGLWFAATEITPAGKVHGYHYLVNGAGLDNRPEPPVFNVLVGGRPDLPVFAPESYLQPGVPSGKLTEVRTHVSKIYDGMKALYRVYVPAQYDPAKPAAVMVFQDGLGFVDREHNRTLDTIDNLIAAGKIPVIICVFINPGEISATPETPTYKFVKAFSDKWHRGLNDSMRSTEYDTVSDRYPRYLRDEILAEVGAQYNLRKDAYSRAITGGSSGGICSFNAAWQLPDQFSRVLSFIGSFASIQWKEDPANADGGQDYPEKVLREEHRNIRAWLQDGADDLEWNMYGSWPMSNLRMVNALKLKEYDFHFSFGPGGHSGNQNEVEFPQSMTWLWRGYDPSKTEEKYTMDPAEKNKPLYRVVKLNRE